MFYVHLKRICILLLSAGMLYAAKSLQSCPTVWPHRRQPTRFLHPWDSPGKNTGVGCHFLLQLSPSLKTHIFMSVWTQVFLVDHNLLTLLYRCSDWPKGGNAGPFKLNSLSLWYVLGFPCSSAGKESTCNAGDLGSIPGLGRSSREGKATHSSILAWRIPWTVVGHD